MRERFFGDGRRWLALLVSSLPLMAMAGEPSATQNNTGGEANTFAPRFERLARGTSNTMCGIGNARRSLLCWGNAGTVDWPMFVGRPKEFKYAAPILAPRGEIPTGSKLEKASVEYGHMCTDRRRRGLLLGRGLSGKPRHRTRSARPQRAGGDRCRRSSGRCPICRHDH
jgi:hypothetical protein